MLLLDEQSGSAEVDVLAVVEGHTALSDLAEPEGDAQGNARFEHMFDPWLTCSHKVAEVMAHNIITHWNLEIEVRHRKLRAADEQNRDAIVKAILANLFYVGATGLEPPRFGVSLRAAKQKSSRYERKGFRRLPEILELLATYGALHLERSSTRGVASAVIVPTLFAADLSRWRVHAKQFGQVPGRETIILSRVDRDFAGRNAGRELVEYSDTPETYRYRAELECINSFLLGADIRLENAEGKSQPSGLPILTRHFNLPPDAPEGVERFDLGGRLFGWWQNLPKAQRSGIRIKGEPVADLDFVSMFLRLAYLEVGHLPPEGDLYAAVPGLSEPRWRPGVKKTTLAMLFRQTPLTRAPRGTRGELPADVTGPQLRQAIRDAHPALADVFETGIGLRLMFTESQILVAALLALVEKGLPAIAMHDGLMVGRSKADRAATIMGDAAESVTGHRLPISLKTLY